MGDTLTKEAKEVKKAKFLLEAKAKYSGKYDPSSLAQMVGIKSKLAMISDKYILAAQAELRGEVGPSMQELAGKTTDTAARDKEWSEVLVSIRAQTTKWAQPAMEVELQVQVALINYSGAMSPLLDAFERAKDLKVPGVKGKADKVFELLQVAQRSLVDYSGLVDKRLEELENFIKLVDLLEQSKPPATLEEVRGALREHQNSIQALKSAEEKSKAHVATINKQCKASQATIESTIKTMVTAAVAWRETEDIRAGAEWAETIAGGIVNVVQVADAEPLSAVGVQGVHMLIKGVCDSVKLLAAAFQAHELAKLKVDDVVDKLLEEDFINFKLDGIKMAISWAAEPLGFIPNVGPLVRTIITAVSDGIIGTLKKAAKKQADAIRAKKQPPAKKEDFAEEIDAVRETIMETAKLVIEENLKAVKHLTEVVEGTKSPEEVIPALAIKLAMALAGPAMETALAEIIPKMGMVSPEAIRATLDDTRASINTLAHENIEMQDIKTDFGFDEAHAKTTNVDVLDKLQEGQSCAVALAVSSSLRSTGGVALLIGDGHADDNRLFVEQLLKSKSGYTGTVTLKSKGRFGELEFSFDSGDAKEYVKGYIDSYGSGDGRITRKSLSFA